MADEKIQEQLTKSTSSAAQGTTNEGEVPHQTDSPVGAVAKTSAKGKEATEETPETISSSDEDYLETTSSDEEPPENLSSDDESDQDITHVDAHGETQPYQPGGKPDDDKYGGTTNPSSSVLGKRRLTQQYKSSSKRRRQLLSPSFSRAKLQTVMKSDEHGSGRLLDVPLVLESPALVPTAAGLRPFSGYQPGHWNDYYGRRYRGMLNEMLADALIKLLKQMPLVYTNGGIPDGATTRGFLYGYSSGPVIVCACHGQFFNASEFVRHASGLEVDNPIGLINLEFFCTTQFDG